MPQTHDLRAKDLQDLDTDDIVSCHLNRAPYTWTRDHVVRSSLDFIDEEMRQSRGKRLTANYAPLLAGFAILDQLGSTYADAAAPTHPQGGGAIHRALHAFCDYPAMGPEVKAFYALRNGLMHDASLTSFDVKAQQWYIFRYDRQMPDAVQLAATPWDGDRMTLGPDTVTMVNPRVFTDQVSAAISRVRDCHLDRRSDLTVLQSGADILHKYLFWDARGS